MGQNWIEEVNRVSMLTQVGKEGPRSDVRQMENIAEEVKMAEISQVWLEFQS